MVMNQRLMSESKQLKAEKGRTHRLLSSHQERTLHTTIILTITQITITVTMILALMRIQTDLKETGNDDEDFYYHFV